MDILNDITVICFSPTHTSRTIAEAVAAGMSGTPGGTAGHAGASQQIRTVDLTLDRSDSPITVGAGETVVLGAPVYAGRVAPEAVRRLRRIQVAAGASVPAVVTVTYGNRNYEDALVELYDLAISLGLSPFAAGGGAQLQHPGNARSRGASRHIGPGRCPYFRRRMCQETEQFRSICPIPHQGKPALQRAVPPGLRQIP